jgi:hypothetical protein
MKNSDPDSDGNRCTMMCILPPDLTYPSSFPPLCVCSDTHNCNLERKMK